MCRIGTIKVWGTILLSLTLINCGQGSLKTNNAKKTKSSASSTSTNDDGGLIDSANGSTDETQSSIDYILARDIYIIEGQSAELSVERLSNYNQSIEISWSISPNQAGATSTFRGDLSGILSFASFSNSTSIPIDTIDDQIVEENRVFEVTLFNTANPNRTYTARVTVLDDEGLPSVTAQGTSVIEGETADITFQLSAASDFQVEVPWTLENVTTVSGVDYPSSVAPAGTIVFASGETSKVLSIQTSDNDESDGAKSLNINFGTATYAQLQTNQVTVSIQDNENNSITTGNNHTCAAIDGQLKCWGYNGHGQLGDGTTTARRTPVQVSGMESGVTAVSAGENHTCAIKNGALYCWGYNAYGQLGLGHANYRYAPRLVVGLEKDVASVSTGSNFTCATLSNGSLKCWGYNGYGQLGNGSTTHHYAPTTVVGGERGVASVSAGANHACAIIENENKKALWCWGHNNFGQLGDGTNSTSHSLRRVSGMEEGLSKVVVAHNNSCAIQNGQFKCWGYNGYGELGDGSTTHLTAPYIIEASGVELIGKAYHSSCRTKSGVLECWGYNAHGTLGVGNTTSNRNYQIVNGVSSVKAISVGQTYTQCVIEQDNTIKCWGRNGYGQVGDDTATQRNAPVVVNF